MQNLLEVKNLTARYGATEVLHGIDLSMVAGSVTALLGANGAGKTTTLRAICQMMVRTTGSVSLMGKTIDSLGTEAIASMGVAHVPDGRGTFQGLTTEENLRLGAYSRKDRRGVQEDFEQVFHYFPRLKERCKQQAGTLSGGEQQMLAIGRALMLKPRLLLLDEPSFGLAPLIVRDIFQIMGRINREQGVSILLVEQNAALALDVADSVYLMETGRIVLKGEPGDIRNNDAIRRIYLGE